MKSHDFAPFGSMSNGCRFCKILRVAWVYIGLKLLFIGAYIFFSVVL